MLGLKLNHVSKRGPRLFSDGWAHRFSIKWNVTKLRLGRPRYWITPLMVSPFQSGITYCLTVNHYRDWNHADLMNLTLNQKDQRTTLTRTHKYANSTHKHNTYTTQYTPWLCQGKYNWCITFGYIVLLFVYFSNSPSDMWKKLAFWGTSMKLGTLIPLVIINVFGYGPRQFHPLVKMAAILLAPLSENGIFLISP